MYVQYWCPLEQNIVAGDENDVWWKFDEHEDICNRGYVHERIDPAHLMDVCIWPHEDEEYILHSVVCDCGYETAKNSIERIVRLQWRKHYKKAMSAANEEAS